MSDDIYRIWVAIILVVVLIVISAWLSSSVSLRLDKRIQHLEDTNRGKK